MDLITQLAIDLDAFLYDYDTYGYAMVTDPGYDHAQDSLLERIFQNIFQCAQEGCDI